MFKLRLLMCAVALATALPAPASAQNSNELEEIRKQIEALKDAYETRIQALEKRLKAAEDAATAAKATAAETQSAQQAAAAGSTAAAPAASQSAFNPAISLILDGRYANFSQDPARRSMTGFLSKADTADALGRRGFSLGETELTMSANIDQLFFGQATLAVEPDGGIGVEEAFGQTTALGHGLTIKGGRFFSAIGYGNSVHAHAWDFVDPALVQRGFLGDNYSDYGVQLATIPPWPIYVEVGGELGRGVHRPGSDRDKNG